ncbi:MAG TPA: FkbM family methyltransferase [Flavobacteriales bacterium]|nr:FkbM family methyltransferase [Flavobacteriales bacterium]
MKTYYCGPLTWGMLRVLRRTGLLTRFNFSVRARIAGRRIAVPIREGIGMTLLVQDEPWMHPLLEGLLAQFPGIFVDVGVNVGQTLCKVKLIAPQRSYVGFEPNPVCIHYAQELVLLQKFTDARIVPAGLSDRDGLLQLELHTASMDDSAATTVSDFRPGFQVFRKLIIPVLRYGTVVRDLALGPVGIVKIDVEGGEREVLLGMEEQLRSDRPAVVLEILPVGRQAPRLPRQQDVEALFSRIGYRMHRIHARDGGLHLESLTGPIEVHDDQSLSNYLALPEERNDVVMAVLRGRSPRDPE